MKKDSIPAGENRENPIVNTTTLTSENKYLSETIEKQFVYLNKLQAIPPCKPVLIKVKDGSTPDNADSRLYEWLYYMDVWHLVDIPIYTRRILDNELIFDPDVKDWNILKTELDKLTTYLKHKNIPFELAYSGGNGCHISIKFGSVGIDEPLHKDIKKYDIDVYKTTRQALAWLIFNESGVDREALQIDNNKINFGKIHRGSMVREYGTLRANGHFKTLIDEVPTTRMEAENLPLRFPDVIKIWDISEHHDFINLKIKEAITKAEKTPDYKDIDLKGCVLSDFPCINKLINEGRSTGRYYGAGAIALASKRAGNTWEQTQPILLKYLNKCATLDNKFSKGDIELRINNVRPLFESTDYNFSCKYIKETFTDSIYCDFQKCIVCKKINDNKEQDYEPEPLNEVVDELRERKILLNLPEDHFVSQYVKWGESVTDAYKEYHIMCALWLLSACTNRKVILKMKQEHIRPNLWTHVLGNSTTSRKSTAVNKARKIFECATDINLPNSDFSFEGYLETLSETPIMHNVKDESSGLLAKYHQKYNDGVFDFECSVYDGTPDVLEKRLSSGKAKTPKTYTIKNYYVTKLYATTPDKLSKCMTIDDFMCGYGYRWLYAYPNYKHDRKPLAMEDNEDTKAWSNILCRVKEFYLIFNKRETELEFEMDRETLDYYDELCIELEKKADEQNSDVLSSIVGRIETIILKIAMLLELGKKQVSTNITSESIKNAFDMVANFFIPSIMEVIDRIQEDIKFNLIERLISILRRLGGKATHTKLLRDSNMKVREFTECIDTMKESHRIKTIQDKPRMYQLINHNIPLNFRDVRKVRNVREVVEGDNTSTKITKTLSTRSGSSSTALYELTNVTNKTNKTNISSNSVTQLKTPHEMEVIRIEQFKTPGSLEDFKDKVKMNTQKEKGILTTDAPEDKPAYFCKHMQIIKACTLKDCPDVTTCKGVVA